MNIKATTTKNKQKDKEINKLIFQSTFYVNDGIEGMAQMNKSPLKVTNQKEYEEFKNKYTEEYGEEAEELELSDVKFADFLLNILNS